VGTYVDGIRLFKWCVSIDLMLGSLRGNKLIAAVGLAVVIITMVTSNQLSIYASPTTEDGGWTEGDYEGSLEEQEEQAQEDWEDAGRPGEIDEEDDEDDNNGDDDNDDRLVECEDGSFMETEELCEQSETLIPCSDGSYAPTIAECPPEPETLPLPPCDGSFQDCVTPYGHICPAGSGAHECEIDEPELSFVTCFDGSSAATLAECPTPESEIPNPAFAPGFYAEPVLEISEKEPLPYCHTPEGKAAKSCHDMQDVDETTGRYPCNDGMQKADYKDCTDATKMNNNDDCRKNPLMKECYKNVNKDSENDKTKVIQKTTVIQSASATTNTNANAADISNAADVSNCKLDGSADGILQKFDSVKYQACGLFTSAQKAYSDGFVMGCTQVGNTQLICQALADTSVLNMKTQLTQTQTAIQPTQAIQPATIGG
jgi:hypothetical protein